MSELRDRVAPELERPVLIAAFRGWNDGGQGASLAGAYLARAWAAVEFATIDPESFYDFQATRPTCRSRRVTRGGSTGRRTRSCMRRCRARVATR